MSVVITSHTPEKVEKLLQTMGEYLECDFEVKRVVSLEISVKGEEARPDVERLLKIVADGGKKKAMKSA